MKEYTLILSQTLFTPVSSFHAHTRTHRHTDTHTHSHTHTHTHTHKHTHMYACMHAHTCTNMHIRTHSEEYLIAFSSRHNCEALNSLQSLYTAQFHYRFESNVTHVTLFSSAFLLNLYTLSAVTHSAPCILAGQLATHRIGSVAPSLVSPPLSPFPPPLPHNDWTVASPDLLCCDCAAGVGVLGE